MKKFWVWIICSTLILNQAAYSQTSTLQDPNEKPVPEISLEETQANPETSYSEVISDSNFLIQSSLTAVEETEKDDETVQNARELTRKGLLKKQDDGTYTVESAPKACATASKPAVIPVELATHLDKNLPGGLNQYAGTEVTLEGRAITRADGKDEFVSINKFNNIIIPIIEPDPTPILKDPKIATTEDDIIVQVEGEMAPDDIVIVYFKEKTCTDSRGAAYCLENYEMQCSLGACKTTVPYNQLKPDVEYVAYIVLFNGLTGKEMFRTHEMQVPLQRVIPPSVLIKNPEITMGVTGAKAKLVVQVEGMDLTAGDFATVTYARSDSSLVPARVIPMQCSNVTKTCEAILPELTPNAPYAYTIMVKNADGTKIKGKLLNQLFTAKPSRQVTVVSTSVSPSITSATVQALISKLTSADEVVLYYYAPPSGIEKSVIMNCTLESCSTTLGNLTPDTGYQYSIFVRTRDIDGTKATIAEKTGLQFVTKPEVTLSIGTPVVWVGAAKAQIDTVITGLDPSHVVKLSYRTASATAWRETLTMTCTGNKCSVSNFSFLVEDTNYVYEIAVYGKDGALRTKKSDFTFRTRKFLFSRDPLVKSTTDTQATISVQVTGFKSGDKVRINYRPSADEVGRPITNGEIKQAYMECTATECKVTVNGLKQDTTYTYWLDWLGVNPQGETLILGATPHKTWKTQKSILAVKNITTSINWNGTANSSLQIEVSEPWLTTTHRAILHFKVDSFWSETSLACTSQTCRGELLSLQLGKTYEYYITVSVGVGTADIAKSEMRSISIPGPDEKGVIAYEYLPDGRERKRTFVDGSYMITEYDSQAAYTDKYLQYYKKDGTRTKTEQYRNNVLLAVDHHQPVLYVDSQNVTRHVIRYEYLQDGREKKIIFTDRYYIEMDYDSQAGYVDKHFKYFTPTGQFYRRDVLRYFTDGRIIRIA